MATGARRQIDVEKVNGRNAAACSLTPCGIVDRNAGKSLANKLVPSIMFPLGPPFCGDEWRAERALGCGGIFPRSQQAGARVRKRRREGNEWAARVERRYTIQRTIRWLSRTAVRWGPQFSSRAPPRSPAPPFDHFPFGQAQEPFIQLENFGNF